MCDMQPLHLRQHALQQLARQQVCPAELLQTLAWPQLQGKPDCAHVGAHVIVNVIVTDIVSQVSADCTSGTDEALYSDPVLLLIVAGI
jgi:hypothetical protein